eukprot:364518-Amorphochlora_amoeboformis.AAC.1
MDQKALPVVFQAIAGSNGFQDTAVSRRSNECQAIAGMGIKLLQGAMGVKVLVEMEVKPTLDTKSASVSGGVDGVNGVIAVGVVGFGTSHLSSKTRGTAQPYASCLG